MEFKEYSHIFMLGIGGIGMSALARYFKLKGKFVAGFDRVNTQLTQTLENEGFTILYKDNVDEIPYDFSIPEKTLVIYTPAIKNDNTLLTYFSQRQFKVFKRAEILGRIALEYKTIAVAGTHGKTTITAMVSHLLHQSAVEVNAMVGGIMKNYQSNFIASAKSEFLVTEADEYDRSFLKLYPHFAVITSCDADHLDIYGTEEELLKAYGKFADQVSAEGLLLTKKGLQLNVQNASVTRKYTYSVNDRSADIYPDHLQFNENMISFDLVTPQGVLEKLTMQPTGLMNVENAVAATFIALQAGADRDEIKEGLSTFKGVRRRFDMLYNDNETIYIDDYAHHPQEIRSLVKSVKSIYPSRHITGIFQPHLFSRTLNFADEFARSLEQLDTIILLDIYPAREKPIEGVNSAFLFKKINHNNKFLFARDETIEYLLHHHFEVLLTIGAGDIDTLAQPLLKMIRHKKVIKEK